MKIGTLVRWTAENDEDYGCLGVVTKDNGYIFWVTWADGDVVDYSHKLRVNLEVLCE